MAPRIARRRIRDWMSLDRFQARIASDFFMFLGVGVGVGVFMQGLLKVYA